MTPPTIFNIILQTTFYHNKRLSKIETDHISVKTAVGKKIQIFIISLTYIVDLAKVDELLPLHVEYLKKQYEKDNFIASGRKIPRTGGIIFSKLKSLENFKKF